MGMELKVNISLSDGDMYPNEVAVNRNFEVSLPWAPGNHNAETALVEAIGTIVNFGEVIGELHEELTAKYDEKLAKKAADEAEKARMAEEFGKPTEPPEPEEHAEPAEPAEALPATGEGEGGGLGNANGDGGAYGGNGDDEEVPQ